MRRWIEYAVENYRSKNSFGFQLAKDLKERQVSQAIEKYAKIVKPEEVVALMDTTVFRSGKTGFLFTERYLYGDRYKDEGPIELMFLEKAEVRPENNSCCVLTYEDGRTREVDVSVFLDVVDVLNMMIGQRKQHEGDEEEGEHLQEADQKERAEFEKAAVSVAPARITERVGMDGNEGSARHREPVRESRGSVPDGNTADAEDIRIGSSGNTREGEAADPGTAKNTGYTDGTGTLRNAEYADAAGIGRDAGYADGTGTVRNAGYADSTGTSRDAGYTDSTGTVRNAGYTDGVGIVGDAGYGGTGGAGTLSDADYTDAGETLSDTEDSDGGGMLAFDIVGEADASELPIEIIQLEDLEGLDDLEDIEDVEDADGPEDPKDAGIDRISGGMKEDGPAGPEESYEQALELAESGDSAAMYRLAVMYYDGRQPDKDKKQALRWFRESAKAEYVPAMLQMMRFYNDGELVKQNYQLSMSWVKKAAATGEPEGQFALADAYIYGTAGKQDVEAGLAILEDRAANGDEKAQQMMERVRREMKEAKERFDAGIRNPSTASGYYEMGMYCQKGDGYYTYPKEAAEYFQKAAEKEHVDAQYQLACAYYSGDGVRKNEEICVNWLKKAASKSHKEATELLGGILEKQRIKREKAEFKNHLRQAEKGDCYAQSRVAELYIEGTGVKKDVQKAIEWYEKAAESDEGYAARELAKIYSAGKIVEKDEERAAYWRMVGGVLDEL